MKWKSLIIVALLWALVSFSAVPFTAAAEPEPAKPVLKSGDVKQFIKTFPLLKKDLEKFGMKYEAKGGDVTVPEGLKANRDFVGILKKHGWDEHFWHKFTTIAMGYAFVRYGKGIKEADPEIAKAIKEIDGNPAISDRMKAHLKKQLTAAKGLMKTQGEQLKRQIHKADMDLIRPLVEELKAVLEDNR